MRPNSVGIAAALLLHCRSGAAGAAASRTRGSQRSGSSEPANGRFELTVDSIMRGPDLVGYPPTGLRWSADSQKLYFEWRKPGEDKASTYVVGRDGRRAAQTDRGRGEEHPAGGRRPLGQGAPPRPLCRRRRHRHG